MRAVIQRVKWASVAVPRPKVAKGAPAAPQAPPPVGQQGAATSAPALPSTTSSELVPSPHSDNTASTPSGVEIVTIESKQEEVDVIGTIGQGMVVLLGIGKSDTDADLAYLVDRTINLRIFADSDNAMNLSLLDIGGEVLVVSQFTLYGDSRKGRRPSFFDAMEPAQANGLYTAYIQQLRAAGVTVAHGAFGATMHVELLNDGPVTLLIDSKKTF